MVLAWGVEWGARVAGWCGEVCGVGMGCWGGLGGGVWCWGMGCGVGMEHDFSMMFP